MGRIKSFRLNATLLNSINFIGYTNVLTFTRVSLYSNAAGKDGVRYKDTSQFYIF